MSRMLVHKCINCLEIVINAPHTFPLCHCRIIQCCRKEYVPPSYYLPSFCKNRIYGPASNSSMIVTVASSSLKLKSRLSALKASIKLPVT
jgi:hypothetical protein